MIRVTVTGEIKTGDCTLADCPLTKLYGPHQHDIPGTLMRVHPEDHADMLRAKGLGVDLWGPEK
ncbi:MAG TPA: hypothetical protein VEI26_06240 [Terriglobales bacterium]|nr:hypothetical protein [Terriglobales bacterium]